MTNETIVAVFDSAEHAALAVRDLEAAGVPSSAIGRHADVATDSTTTTTTGRDQGFWASLFGGESEYPHDKTVYDRSLKSGATVVTVQASGERLTQVIDVLERHNPIDIDERASSYGLANDDAATVKGTTAAPASPTAASGRDTTIAHSGEEVVPLAEEQLTVGKRVVNRGTTRIRRFVVETPVEEAVTLHSEHVSVDRRPAEAGTTVGDTAFTDRVVEVTASDEEAVISKTARVKEEVVINKAATERVETVRDTVRREDVEVTRDGHASETSSATAPHPPNARPGV